MEPSEAVLRRRYNRSFSIKLTFDMDQWFELDIAESETGIGFTMQIRSQGRLAVPYDEIEGIQAESDSAGDAYEFIFGALIRLGGEEAESKLLARSAIEALNDKWIAAEEED